MTSEEIVLAVISALFGGGGGAALMRARGQNRSDAQVSLNTGQIAFNTALALRVKDLEVAQAAQDERYDAMVKANAKLSATVQIQDARLEIQADNIAKQANHLTILGVENEELRRENRALHTQIEQLARQVKEGLS